MMDGWGWCLGIERMEYAKVCLFQVYVGFSVMDLVIDEMDMCICDPREAVGVRLDILLVASFIHNTAPSLRPIPIY